MVSEYEEERIKKERCGCEGSEGAEWGKEAWEGSGKGSQGEGSGKGSQGEGALGVSIRVLMSSPVMMRA